MKMKMTHTSSAEKANKASFVVVDDLYADAVPS